MQKTIKIEGIEVAYDCRDAEEGKDWFAASAIARVHAEMVKKAWSPLVKALKTTGDLPDNMADIIAAWAQEYTLGDRSKKQDALARKKAKAYFEDLFRQQRYSLTDAKQRGAIDASVQEMYKRGKEGRFLEEAASELSAEDMLEPLPITMEEFQRMQGSEESSGENEDA